MPFIKKSNKTNTCTKDKKVLLKTVIFIFIAFRTVTDLFIINNIVFFIMFPFLKFPFQ